MPISGGAGKEELAEKLKPIYASIDQESISFDYSTGRLTNLDEFFNGHLVDSAGHVIVPTDVRDFWTNNGITVRLPNQTIVSYTKRSFNYPHLTWLAQYPDLSGFPDYAGIWVGFELGTGGLWGLIGFWARVVGGVNQYVFRGTSGYASGESDLTSYIIVNPRTTIRYYTLKLNRPNVELYINNVLQAVFLNGFSVNITGPPYGIFGFNTPLPTSMPAFTEVTCRGYADLTFPLKTSNPNAHYMAFRVSDGDPLPPRAYSLYLAGANTKLAGYSISSGSVSSHPIPVFGYRDKTILFQANQAGTLLIEVLAQSGNWRTYDSVSVSAGTLLSYIMTGEAVLARVTFTPSAYPATVNEGEVDLR
jgi:hypothetical protein